MSDWEVPNSDDDDDPTYIPSPDIIVSLYNRIEKGEVFKLEIPIVPRRKPEDIILDSAAEPADEEEECSEENEDSSKSISEPNEFDFDSQAVDTVKRFTPRRTPNRQQTKKVTRMHKVCSNIIKYEKLDAAQQELEKTA